MDFLLEFKNIGP